jgi:hypothetical protein
VDLTDPTTLRLATAYADLLEATGEAATAELWRAAVAAHTPEEDVEFAELWRAAVAAHTPEEDVEFSEEDLPVADAAPDEDPAATVSGSEPAVPADTVEDADGPGDDAVEDADEPDGVVVGDYDFDHDVEAEVAELLGETDADEGHAEH